MTQKDTNTSSNFKIIPNHAARLARLEDSQSSQLHNLGELRSDDCLKLGDLKKSVGDDGTEGKNTPAQFGLRKSQLKKRKTNGEANDKLDDLLNFENDTDEREPVLAEMQMRERQPTFGSTKKHIAPARATEVLHMSREVKKKENVDKKSRNTMAVLTGGGSSGNNRSNVMHGTSDRATLPKTIFGGHQRRA